MERDEEDEPITDLDVHVDTSAVGNASHAADDEPPTRQVAPEVLQREIERSRAAGGSSVPDAAKVEELVSASMEAARRDLPTAPADFKPVAPPEREAAPPQPSSASIALDGPRGPRGTVKMARPRPAGAPSPPAPRAPEPDQPAPPRRRRSVLLLLLVVAIAIGAGIAALVMTPGN